MCSNIYAHRAASHVGQSEVDEAGAFVSEFKAPPSLPNDAQLCDVSAEQEKSWRSWHEREEGKYRKRITCRGSLSASRLLALALVKLKSSAPEIEAGDF